MYSSAFSPSSSRSSSQSSINCTSSLRRMDDPCDFIAHRGDFVWVRPYGNWTLGIVCGKMSSIQMPAHGGRVISYPSWDVLMVDMKSGQSAIDSYVPMLGTMKPADGFILDMMYNERILPRGWVYEDYQVELVKHELRKQLMAMRLK